MGKRRRSGTSVGEEDEEEMWAVESSQSSGDRVKVSHLKPSDLSESNDHNM